MWLGTMWEVAIPFAGSTHCGAQARQSTTLSGLSSKYSPTDAGCCLLRTTACQPTTRSRVSELEVPERIIFLQVSYTWEKTLRRMLESEQPEPTTIQNPADLHEEKAISIQDLPHTLVLALLYQLPLGKGKRYFKQWTGELPRWRMGEAVGSALRVRDIDRILLRTRDSRLG